MMKHYFSYPLPKATYRLLLIPASLECTGDVAKELKIRQPRVWNEIQKIKQTRVGKWTLIEDYLIIFNKTSARVRRPDKTLATPHNEGHIVGALDGQNDELVRTWAEQGLITIVPLELI